jgi:hypothetical protein
MRRLNHAGIVYHAGGRRRDSRGRARRGWEVVERARSIAARGARIRWLRWLLVALALVAATAVIDALRNIFQVR